MKVTFKLIYCLYFGNVYFIKYLFESYKIKNVELIRKLNIYLVSLKTLDHTTNRTIFSQALLILYIYSFDYLIDEKNLLMNVDYKKYIYSKEIRNILLNKLVEMEFIRFIKTSIYIRDNQLKDFDDYLNQSKYSIGIPCAVKLVEEMTNTNCDNKYLDLGAKIIRILNDQSTYKKDILERSNNLFINKNNLKIRELDHLRNNFHKHNPRNNSELFLKKLVLLSNKFYTNSTDFDL